MLTGINQFEDKTILIVIIITCIYYLKGKKNISAINLGQIKIRELAMKLSFRV